MKKILVTSALAFATIAFLGMSQLSAGDGAKCGAGKCGNTTKAGKCGNTTKVPEGKCGAGKCGDAKKAVEAVKKCGASGKCGTGKCGTAK